MTTLDNPVMENPNPSSPWPIAMRIGGIAGMILIVFGLLTYLMGYTDPSRAREPLAILMSILSYVIWIGALVIAVRTFRQEQNNILSFGLAFRTAFFTAIVMALLNLVWTFIFTNLVAPEFYTDLLDGMRGAMEDQGAPDDSIDMMMGIYEKLFSPLIAPFFGLVMSVIGGAVMSLIVGAIMKKDAPET